MPAASVSGIALAMPDHGSLWATAGGDGRACLWHVGGGGASSSSAASPAYASGVHDDACVDLCWASPGEGAGWGALAASSDGLLAYHAVPRAVKYDVLL